MDSVSTLVAEARAEGLEVARVGDRLVVRGPKRLESLALELLQHKAEILGLLAPNICLDCSAPCGSAARCSRCASLRVPLPSGWVRCPQCAGGIPLGRHQCIGCAASEVAERAWRAAS